MRSGKELKAFLPTLVVLIIAVLINYADRGNLALAAPIIKTEWGLSASQIGILLSSFFVSYMALQIPVGWLVDRFNVNVLLAAGFLIWSLSTAAAGLVSGFATMLCLRLLLGTGEAVMFPACSRICCQYLPERSRGFANALLVAAIRWGTALGTFGGGLLMAHWGWRRTFMAIGLAGLLWLPAWAIFKPQPIPVERSASRVRVNVSVILSLRCFWGAATGHFCVNYVTYFVMSWLPYYLVHERGVSMQFMAGTAGLLYMIDSFSSIVTGWVTDRKICAGGDALSVRKWSMAIGFSIATVALFACAAAGPSTYLPCLAGVAIGNGVAGSGVFAMAQTLAGPRLSGRWTGLQNCFANVAGVVGPAVTGFLIDLTGNFHVAFILAAAVAVVGGLSWIFGIRRAEVVDLLPAPAGS